MNDIQLRQDILNELDFDPRVEASHIGVAVKDGIVTLTGYVNSYAERVAAGHAAQRVKGVHGIAQDIEVRYPDEKKTADDQIARRALDIIAWDTTIPDEHIQVMVQNGWVTLKGHADWAFQRNNAEAAVRRLGGVLGVTNLIEVRPKVSAPDVKRRIEEALKRNAQMESSNIIVGVTGNNVTLNGKIHAWHERNIAEQAAWAAAGVSQVEDNLRIA
ncbi:Osmotically-inducible protein Y precursor [Afipia felis]|uniref:Osmotically-inducible protein Y n=1 Tax=Afipia felis TaxID=1035 RepID=A0A090MGH7_AFIFE|nr:BON domain-containing protein [Afipia felis]CEG06746.1 Osmotically-inducible protein Y precursor [Afipia felis]